LELENKFGGMHIQTICDYINFGGQIGSILDVIGKKMVEVNKNAPWLMK
jgi:hypothetical protein